MKKADIINLLLLESNCTRSSCEAVYDALVNVAKKELKENGEFSLPGLGSLKVTIRKERNGINPSTKEKIIIPETKKVTFKALTALKNEL